MEYETESAANKLGKEKLLEVRLDSCCHHINTYNNVLDSTRIYMFTRSQSASLPTPTASRTLTYISI